MKYWRGYIAAGIFALIAWALSEFAKAHSTLVDMIYPYMTRLVQTSLAQWTSGTEFLVWQILAVVLGVVVLASIVLLVVLRWNVVQWLGWVLAGASFLFCMHTCIYGLNTSAGSLSDDIRLDSNVLSGSLSELVDTTIYLRDKANELAEKVPRDTSGKPNYPSFETLAAQAGEGFTTLTFEHSFSVFAGSTLPVKKLGWEEMFTSMGIDGFTMPLTGEAAVNPNMPVVAQPFTMCHEMAHRMCIAPERDANLAAFLACRVNSDPIHQYSGYFMALRYCYNSLRSAGTSSANAAAKEVKAGFSQLLQQDMQDYDAHYAKNIDDKASNLASSVNDTYIKVSGDESGTKSYGEVTDLLINWYVQEIDIPTRAEDENAFDPYDEEQVDLKGWGGK